MAELSSGILCGCFPMFPQFVRYVSHRGTIRTSRLGTSSGGSVPSGHTASNSYTTNTQNFRCVALKNLAPGTTPKDSQCSTLRSSAQSAEAFVIPIGIESGSTERHQYISERGRGRLSSRHGSEEEAVVPIKARSSILEASEGTPRHCNAHPPWETLPTSPT